MTAKSAAKDADGKFAKGNGGGRGGSRPGAGRKPNHTRATLDMLLTGTPCGAKGAKRRTLIDIAMDTLAEAMLNRDGDGLVTGPAVRAAIDVADRSFGKARQTLKISGDRRDIVGALSAVAAGISAGRVQDLFGGGKAKSAVKREEGRDAAKKRQSAKRPGRSKA